MSLLTWILFLSFASLGYLLAPSMIFWGWVLWVKEPKLMALSPIVSLVGLILATTSAMLALLTASYARVHTFQHFDPVLRRIMRWGLLLSASGLLFGIGGVFQKGPTRWQSPLSAVGTAAFWVLAAEFE